MNNTKLRHTGLVGYHKIGHETTRGTPVKPRPYHRVDPMVRAFCNKYSFPIPEDMEDEKRIKRLYSYAEFHVQESMKRLGRAILRALKTDKKKLERLFRRHIEQIFELVVVLGLVTIGIYFLKVFIL